MLRSCTPGEMNRITVECHTGFFQNFLDFEKRSRSTFGDALGTFETLYGS